MAAWANPPVNASALFLGAHAETLQALAKLQLLIQITPRMSLAQRQQVAAEIVLTLWPLVRHHHHDEEHLLFPVMRRRASETDTATVNGYVERLTREHRAIESMWERSRPDLLRLSQGMDVELPVDACQALVRLYQSHAQFEETIVLPLAAALLTRSDQDMISVSLALRHDLRNLPAYI